MSGGRTASKHGKQRRVQRLSFWLLVAGILHAHVLIVGGLLAYFKAPRDKDLLAMPGVGLGGGEPLEISTVDDELARKLLSELDEAEAKAKEEEQKKELEQPEPPGQVVQIAKPTEEKRPEHARFAAEYDSTVTKETRKYGKFDAEARQGVAAGEAEETRMATPPAQPKAASKPTPPGALALRTPGARGQGPGQEPRESEPAQATGASSEKPQTGASDPEGVLAPGGRLLLRPPILGGGLNGENGARPSTQGAGIEALTPTQQQLARAISSGTDDHLRDIDDGDETALNAKKWKHSSFFNRVKAQVREHWRPDEAYQRRDPTGSIYGNKDRYTLLRVQLKPDGTLAAVSLESPSGVEFLDDEAVEAFKQAQPFPNPPRQLVEVGSGLINFKFGFYFELSGAPTMKVFRYNSM